MQTKAEIRAEAEALAKRFEETGGQVQVIEGRTTNGYTHADWARKVKGLKVATVEEIDAERTRRMLNAIKANTKDAPQRVMELLSGRRDKDIKFDIEHDRRID